MDEIATAFGRDMDKEMMSVYFKHLIPYSLYQVTLAVHEVIERDERFPVVSRIRSLAATKKAKRPDPAQNVELIEEVVHSNDLPRNKEDFFKAMKELTDKVSF